MGRSASSSERIHGVPLFRVSSVEALDSPIDRRADYYRLTALEQLREAGKLRPAPLLNLPNVLTLSRVAMVPVFVIAWFVPGEPAALVAAVTFGAAGVTDWLDGYLARRMGITSAFGAFLDPVADKIMVATALILLSSTPPAAVPTVWMAIPVGLMISREVTMSSLREWAASCGDAVHKAVKVNSLGKWKTALQMASLSALLFLRCPEARAAAASHPPSSLPHWHSTAVLASHFVLCVSTILALWSLAYYMSNVWHFFRYPEIQAASKEASAVAAAASASATGTASKTPPNIDLTHSTNLEGLVGGRNGLGSSRKVK